MKQIPITPIDVELMDVAERAKQANLSAAKSVLADTIRSLRRVIAKAAAEADQEYTAQRISQDKGPTLNFSGKLVGEWTHRHTEDDQRWFDGEVWLTKGGAYIAVIYARSDREGERDLAYALAVEPSDDEFARRCEVMEFFNWRPHARAMAKKMDWKLERDIA